MAKNATQKVQKSSTPSSRKSSGSLKKTSSGSAARPADRNASTLPRAADFEFLARHPRPAPVTERVIGSVCEAFSGRVCATLAKPSVMGFYGTRLVPKRIVESVELAVEAQAVSNRLAHGAEVAKQIGDPPLAFLIQQAALIVRDAAELIAAHPELEDELQDLIAWWTATFPGGGPKAKVDPGSTPGSSGNSAPGGSAPQTPPTEG